MGKEMRLAKKESFLKMLSVNKNRENPISGQGCWNGREP